MKRSTLILLAVVLLAAGGGWAMAYFEHRGRVERAATAALAEARRPGVQLAEIVRGCDAAGLVFLDGKEERILRIADASWGERLAVLLEGGAYERTDTQVLAVSFPLIRLDRAGTTRLELMIVGRRLQAFGPGVQGEYLISPDLASAILNLQMVDTSDA